MTILFLALPARADAVAEAVQGTISDQMAAFLDEDVARAFTYASPGIRRLFGTPERFGAMVQNGYPMVWRPGEVRYLELERTGEDLRQIVEITDRTGRLHRLQYDMVETAQGWRIDGVRFLPAPPPMT